VRVALGEKVVRNSGRERKENESGLNVAWLIFKIYWLEVAG
tara:strand:+ start:599 stop:721 length:123 start_codon:yes stop_codon:yes gene_type:complete